ncbi:MAG: 16S rRNA (guanine(527)-N(7))-methyltransferase RsmG [Chloroflexi bacterium]|nr:16S rRNA (guanine(527)-N(7))-methyltransferase RsmG [Chloroflexota bacterium]
MYNTPVEMKELARAASALAGVQLTASQMAALALFEKELLDWNARFNLTAIDDPAKIRVKHFLDSFTCLAVMRERGMERVIDVGTGAGFPGLPLKIVCPAMQLTLVESVGKKAEFCRHIAATLGLENVTVLTGRAEEVGRMAAHRERYDWALARAVALLPALAEYLLPLVRVGGTALAMKGESAPAEAHAAERALRLLGGRLNRLAAVTLPGVADGRYLVVMDKIAATPPQYPRRVGMPVKKPL